MENFLNTNISLNLDTSSLTATKLSEDQFKADLENHLQEILCKTFDDNMEKQRIKHAVSSLNFACPFCRDSATDNRKKRAHLLLAGRFAGRFKCFNCGESMTFQKFFQKFDHELSLSDIKYINQEMPQDSSFVTDQVNKVTSQILNRDEAYKYAIDREFLKTTLGLVEIGRMTTPIAYQYLINRCQYSHHERYLYNPQYNQIWLLNLIDDRIIGIQFRSLDPNFKGPKYLTLTIDKLRSKLLGDNSEIPEDIAKLSCIFNIFCVDFSKTYQMPVLVTEGPFDAFLLPNCIATAGAGKNFNMSFPFWYIYDNDSTGNEHSMDKLRQGFQTFMWKKFKSEYGIPEVNPYIKGGDNNRKWDVTDIMRYVRDYKIEKKLYWSPYFTNSMLNGLYI